MTLYGERSRRRSRSVGVSLLLLLFQTNIIDSNVAFSVEKRHPAVGNLAGQHAADQPGDRRPDGRVSPARRFPRRLRQRVRVHDRQHQPRNSGVRRPTRHRVEAFASVHVPRPGLRNLFGALLFKLLYVFIIFMLYIYIYNVISRRPCDMKSSLDSTVVRARQILYRLG